MSEQKILLINPPESGRGEYSTPPLGILYLASVLKKNGITVDIVDGYIAGWKGIEEKLNSAEYSIVGVTCYTYARAKALKVAELSKKRNAKRLVILGGAHATIMHRQLIEHYPFVDIAVRGEGEHTFLEICRGTGLDRIAGIAYRKGNEIIVTPERPVLQNLDELPFPAWELIDIAKYPSEGKGVYRGIDVAREPCVPLVFSRGCIGDCVFCSNRMLTKRWRRRSPGNVVDELELLHKSYGARRFAFNDDLFTADRKATLAFCDEVIRRGLTIVFEIVTRTDCVDADLLKALSGAGCFKICFGIESGSAEILKTMRKPIDVAVSERAVAMTKGAGIKAEAMLIAGNIGETAGTINETVEFLKRAQPDEIGLANGLRIFPGTALYEHAKSLGFIDDRFWLSDYHWKIFTKENSKLRLNIFCDAINTRTKVSSLAAVNFIRHQRFYWKVVEDLVKFALERLGIRERRVRPGKYKVAY